MNGKKLKNLLISNLVGVTAFGLAATSFSFIRNPNHQATPVQAQKQASTINPRDTATEMEATFGDLVHDLNYG